jgi:hypothetical protein
MFPAEVPRSIASKPTRRAEMLVYEAFAALSDPDLRVLYSVAWLAPTRYGARDGEADFVILDRSPRLEVRLPPGPLHLKRARSSIGVGQP